MPSHATATPPIALSADDLLAFKIQGFVILEQVFPQATVREWHRAFLPLLERQAATVPSNRGAQRFQSYLPYAPPFDQSEVIAHPRVLGAVQTILGDDVIVQLMGADTPLLGSEYQPTHMDVLYLMPGHNTLPTYVVGVNYPLVDFTEENGPMELWPGTHLLPGTIDIGRNSSGEESPLQRMITTLPPVRPLLRAGDVLLRDLRVWHRGTPNRTTSPRPNLAFVYSRPWFRFGMPMTALTKHRFEAMSDEQRHLHRMTPIVG